MTGYQPWRGEWRGSNRQLRKNLRLSIPLPATRRIGPVPACWDTSRGYRYDHQLCRFYGRRTFGRQVLSFLYAWSDNSGLLAGNPVNPAFYIPEKCIDRLYSFRVNPLSRSNSRPYEYFPIGTQCRFIHLVSGFPRFTELFDICRYLAPRHPESRAFHQNWFIHASYGIVRKCHPSPCLRQTGRHNFFANRILGIDTLLFISNMVCRLGISHRKLVIKSINTNTDFL